MRNLFKITSALAVAAVVAGTGGVAKADILTFAYSLDGGATIIPAGGVITPQAGGAETWSQTVISGPTNDIISVSAFPSSSVSLPTVFLTTDISVDAGGAASHIIIYVVDQGILLPTGTNVYAAKFNGLLSQSSSGAGSAFLDTTNGNVLPPVAGPFGPPVPFTNVVQTQSKSFTTGPGPYSVTEVYDLTLGAGGGATTAIVVSVPGPVVGAGLPGLLAACGGLIALARRRRRKAA
jgi:hypothetical protein